MTIFIILYQRYQLRSPLACKYARQQKQPPASAQYLALTMGNGLSPQMTETPDTHIAGLHNG
eukprot:scaffold2944_cov155-Skeletonema_dohrnii-CCMP3373.AAC.53